MEIQLHRTQDLFANEIKQINKPFIRQFAVPQEYDFHAQRQEFSGGTWTSATQNDVMNFSAVGYFFAQKIYERNGVPIGLIQSAVGGTPIEAWMSEKTLRQFNRYDDLLDQNKDDAYINSTIRNDEERNNLWYQNLDKEDLGLQHKWYTESYQTTDWNEFEVPGSWQDTELENIRGSVWFRKEFEVPTSMTKSEAMLKLETIVDADDTYVNGTCIGKTGYRYPPRRYTVPAGLLKPGKNTITVRVICTQTTDEFIKDMPYKLIANGEEIDLKGNWKYKLGAQTKTLQPQTFFHNYPVGLYNGMITPLSNYCIAGVLWYQGESNTANPYGYNRLFNELVNDWRKNWNQGERLALVALNKAYGEDIVYSGPLYKKMEQIGNTIHLTFDHIGSGLTIRDGDDELKMFTICGINDKFVPATATIHGNQVIVSHEKIQEPQHVRYAWSDNPAEANLYNKEGLPASPFTTE